MNEEEKLKQRIGQRLRWAREQGGLSQGQAAAKLNLHRPTISQIEAGTRSVKVEEFQKFAELYGVDSQWLMRGDEALPDTQDPRIELAARELRKLKKSDLDSILRLIQVLRSGKGDE